jgi:branched-chain amino acid transport system ATP-binding protein
LGVRPDAPTNETIVSANFGEKIMLNVENLSIEYAGVQALRNVCLRVEDKEIVSVIGANGGGKTTLLRTISGILKPSPGKIEFEGERIDGLPPHAICAKGLIQVPEGRQLFPRMKVIENLQMGAYHPEARKKIPASLERIFGLFPILKERKRQKAGLMSGGEQQMLAIARGLMSLPKLLMLDEPSEGLSPVLTENVFSILRQLEKQGLPILLVSQEVAQSLELSSRAYILENSQILLEGKSADLMNDDRVRESYLGM